MTHMISQLPIELRRHIFKFVRHPLAMLFLPTPWEPLRCTGYEVGDEIVSHFIRCFDESVEDLCFPYDFDSQE
jgi:hypothetical protein